MAIDFKSDTWKQVSDKARARLEKAVATILSKSTQWEGVLVARAQYRDALELLKLDPDFKAPTWSKDDD